MVIDTRVALFAHADQPIATVRCPFTAWAALLRGAAIRREVDTVVALFAVAHLHRSVAAAGSQGAVCVAGSISTCVLCCSKVARFGWRDDAIAANARAATFRGHEASQGEVEVAGEGVTFGVKQNDLVDVTDRQPKLGGLGGIQGHAAARRPMQASEIYGEFTVDEDPDVVVSSEAQDFSTFVFKPVHNLRSETKVVATVGELFIHGDPASIVEWEEVAAQVLILPTRVAIEGETIDVRDIHSLCVPVPLVVVGLARGLLTVGALFCCESFSKLAETRVDGLAIDAERRGDQLQSGCVASVGFKVRVPGAAVDRFAIEVTVGNRNAERIAQVGRNVSASVAGLDLAGGRAAVTAHVVAIVALFVVVG